MVKCKGSIPNVVFKFVYMLEFDFVFISFFKIICVFIFIHLFILKRYIMGLFC